MLSVHCTRACEEWRHIRRHPHLFYYYERMKRMFCLSHCKSLIHRSPWPLYTNTQKQWKYVSAKRCQPGLSHLPLFALQPLPGHRNIFTPVVTFLCVHSAFWIQKQNGTHKMHITKTCHFLMQGRFLSVFEVPKPKVWLTHFIRSTKG